MLSFEILLILVCWFGPGGAQDPLSLPTEFLQEGAVPPGWPLTGAPGTPHSGCIELPSETFTGYGLWRVPESSGTIDTVHYRRA